MTTRLLDTISQPSDIKNYTNEQYVQLAHEIREEIISVTSKNGGHVAPSLGVVDVTIALHSILDCPHDKIVFDVGHQAYAHKLLTGRLKQFQTLRTFGGLSGFPKPEESPYDVHPSGHASDSLSVALGAALARDLSGTDEKIVAIIGDAALSGGMAFEALNHIGAARTPMLIILNDNEFSISRNVGGFSNYLGRIRASKGYVSTRDSIQQRLEKNIVGKSLITLGRGIKDSIKRITIPNMMLFEELGIVCTPPIDGHDIQTMRELLPTLLNAQMPVLMHVVTKKGKGYKPAEENPQKFHGIGPFDVISGKPHAKQHGTPTYTAIFSDALIREAQNDNDIVAITAAMPDGTGLSKFADAFPQRFFDVGISEEHALGFASGLALSGKKPVVAIYSTFLQRAVDQMIINNALPNAHVVFAIDRGGLVGDDGPTHHGIFDMAYVRMIPHMRMLVPSNEVELVHALHTALLLDGPIAIRYPRGNATGIDMPDKPHMLEVGKAHVVQEGSDVALLAFGRMVHEARLAAEILQAAGFSVRVVDMRWVKPLDTRAIEESLHCRVVVTLEEGVLEGGIGQAIAAYISGKANTSATQDVQIMSFGISDEFIEQGDVSELFESIGIDGAHIAQSIIEKL
ncbi:MAG: 1-deoxy-D-xylulose-5-phosphate synthase [Eggerthellaceae bacterium]|nr:1-deoxy-D-xylulose-5-phosphate synthase [Eggerthellaceae bacterium]